MSPRIRFSPVILLGLGLSLAASAVACGGNVTQATASSTSGSGGSTGTSMTSSVASVGTGAAVTSSTGPTSSVATTTVSSTTSTVAATTSSTSGAPCTGEAQFPAPPQVQNYGGPVLVSPHIYGIFFSSDDPTIVTALSDFTTKIGGTQYWQTTTSEYGVGAATATIITLTETPQQNLDDNAIQSWLAGKFGTDPSFPAAPTQNDVYIVYYPSGVNISLFGAQSCQYFGGYHNEAQFNGNAFAYAVVPRCQYPGMTAQDTTTGSASHELIEAATDPFPMTNAAYSTVDTQDIEWQDALQASEVGDMCAQQPQNFTTFPDIAPYQVQRTWSNASANAGHDPCVPEPTGEVYYNVAPVMTQTVHYDIQGQMVPVRGIKIPVGGTATIPVDFYADGNIGPWPAQGYDYSSTFMQGPKLLTLDLQPPQGGNCTKGTLTIKVNQAGQGNEEIFFIASSTDGGKTVNWWFGAVSQNP